MHVAVLRGAIRTDHDRSMLETTIWSKLRERSLEEREDGGPKGNPTILAMSQCMEGDDLVLTIAYEYRS